MKTTFKALILAIAMLASSVTVSLAQDYKDAVKCNEKADFEIVKEAFADRQFNEWLQQPKVQDLIFGCANRYPQPIMGSWCGLKSPSYNVLEVVRIYCSGEYDLLDTN